MTCKSWNIDPKLFATFVAICDSGSFARAATMIGRTEAAVSMQMRRLEELVGPPALFEREGRRMRITPRGEMLLGVARKLVSAYIDVVTTLDVAVQQKPVRIGTPEDYNQILAEIIRSFSDQDAVIEMCCEPSAELAKKIAINALDLAVITRQSNEMDAEPLTWVKVVWVASPSFDTSAHAKMPLALFQPGCVGRSQALHAWAATDRPHRVVFSSPSVAGLLSAVRSGSAIAALPLCCVPSDVRILKVHEGVPELPALELVLIRSRSDLSPSAVNFARAVRDHFSGEADFRSQLKPHQPERAAGPRDALTIDL